MRVYQIARELGRPHRATLQLLRELGHTAPSHMATVTEEQEAQLREAVDRQERGAPAVRPAQAASASLDTQQVAAVIGTIDITEGGEVRGATQKAAAPAGKAPVAAKKKKKGEVGRGGRDHHAIEEEFIREAELEGLAMVEDEPETDDFIGPPLPPEGIRPGDVIRTIDLSEVEPDTAAAGARTARARRREAQEARRQRTTGGGPRQPRTLQRQKRRGPKVSLQASQQLEVTCPISLRDLSQVFGVPVNQLIKTLMTWTKDFNWTVNRTVDEEQVEYLAETCDRTVTVGAAKAAEDEFETVLMEEEISAEGEEETRPPVVAVLGHVDHGKTSLLDKIRNTNVVAGEHGGITQHIGAFQVTVGEQVITFLDTPGHEAFTAMRARGANAADIVILVVAADDGVMPQTAEAINHAQAAKVPIVVAINKIDRPDSRPQKVMQELAAHGLTPDEWGGDTVMCPVSAITGEGIEHLLEMIALTSEMSELKANPLAPARGRVIEARKDANRGVTCTLLVENGTLKRGDTVVAGLAIGRVRTMTDDAGKTVQRAGPSRPVEVYGLSEVPEAGDSFHVAKNLRVAKAAVEERKVRQRESITPGRKQVTLANLFGEEGEEEAKELRIILKADVRGSLEPLKGEIEKLEHPEVTVNLLYGGLGTVTRSDVDTAIASNAVIIGFHVFTEPAAGREAKRVGVEIRHYTVIYEVIDDLRAAMERLLSPEEKEEITGHAEIRQIFASSRLGNIAGSYVTDGVIRRGGYVRIFREGKLLYGADRPVQIDSLRRVKDDVREVREGFECGIRVVGYQDIKEGDVLEFYEIREIQRTLS